MSRLVVLVALLAGCAVQPDYQRPAVELPQAWKQSAPRAAQDGRWWTVYRDPALERLVDEALAHNRDLSLAVARVDEARALLGIAQSRLLPSVDAAFDRSRSLSSAATGTLPPNIARERNDYLVQLNVSYEIDLWGRLRSNAGAARADLLATESARETVRLLLAAQVARSYFALRALDQRVELTRRTVRLREDALRLQRRRSEGGLISDFELRQLEAEAASVRAQLPPLERDRELEEAALAVLLGRSPKAIYESAIVRTGAGDPTPGPAVLAEGMPSELLLRRPDLVEAEQRLIAANARVAAARAAFFPSITLTGVLGSESAALASLFSGPAGLWTLAASLAQPIFQGERLQAERAASEARERQALAQYQKAIQTAFREVREALAAQTRARESYEAESQRVKALTETLRLARLRFDHGLASQLDVLDAERGLLAAEAARIEALRSQRAAVSDLYKALGG
ncbi:MAG TPA: efflux transporter outer membrane subunit [Burkholderiales bacterium]|nr:efflux transporter outer membrane subunit [Burkholderiales bacterium]